MLSMMIFPRSENGLSVGKCSSIQILVNQPKNSYSLEKRNFKFIASYISVISKWRERPIKNTLIFYLMKS